MLRYCFYPIAEMDEAGNCLLLINRMMEHAESSGGKLGDAGGGGGGAKKRDNNWFEDVRNTHQHQAEYLLKLARLREELITQEHSNLLNAMERVYTEAYSRTHTHTAMPVRPGKKRTGMQTTGPQNFPSRHKKMQQEKAERLERFRRGRSPPLLEPIEGRQMADPSKVIAPISAREASSLSNAPMGVRYHDENTDDKKLLELLSSARNGTINLQQFLKPTSSIPHVGYKTLKSDRSGTGSSEKIFSKQKPKSRPSHQLNPRTPGLFNGIIKHSNGQSSYERDVTLSPCALSIESQLEKRHRMLEEDACSAPRATPEIWERYLAGDMEASQLPKGMKQRLGGKSKANRETPKDQMNRRDKVGSVGYNDFMLRRGTSTVQDSVQSQYSPRQKEESKDAGKFPTFRRNETNEWIDRVAMENTPHSGSQSDRQKPLNNDISLPDINQTQLKPQPQKDAMSLVSIDTDRDPSPSCRKLVVEMPDILFLPPTPAGSPDNEDAEDQPAAMNKSLQKTFKQNALRQKEIQNLLEDVKEFTQIAETLKENVNKR